MTTTKMTVLRVLRVERGFTLFDVGRKAGLDEPALSRVERGQRALNEDQAERVASALGVDVDRVFVETDGAYAAAPLELAATG